MITSKQGLFARITKQGLHGNRS